MWRANSATGGDRLGARRVRSSKSHRTLGDIGRIVFSTKRFSGTIVVLPKDNSRIPKLLKSRRRLFVLSGFGKFFVTDSIASRYDEIKSSRVSKQT